MLDARMHDLAGRVFCIVISCQADLLGSRHSTGGVVAVLAVVSGSALCKDSSAGARSR